MIHSVATSQMVIPLNHRGRPAIMAGALAVSDIAALLLAVFVSVLLKILFEGQVGITAYLRLWPLLFIFPCIYSMVGLYSGVALSAPEELRRTAFVSILLFLTLAGLTVSVRGAETSFTYTLATATGMAVICVPLFRAITRRIMASSKLWGHPAVILGTGAVAREALENIQRHPELGLTPVLMVDNHPNASGRLMGVPVVNSSEAPLSLAALPKRAWAVIACEDRQQANFLRLAAVYNEAFSRVLLIPNLPGACSLVASPRNLGGMLGLEVHHSALRRDRLKSKRALDLLLTLSGGIFIAPLFVLVAIAIKLDSSGPVFYRQRRIGRGGKEFLAWKFRTMVTNADESLACYLDERPELRDEWQRHHKLLHDPRITRVGKVLRTTSLDELPQIWNVLKGEMSLVGPRPIVEAEVQRYGDHFDLYTCALGGVTGLWQVSGRNNTTYEERVRLDAFYVRNWSVWLDLCILLRTIGVVLFRRGAY
jgi:Undecaprenyl-phosphate galactose phosphotransferase WbaP